MTPEEVSREIKSLDHRPVQVVRRIPNFFHGELWILNAQANNVVQEVYFYVSQFRSKNQYFHSLDELCRWTSEQPRIVLSGPTSGWDRLKDPRFISGITLIFVTLSGIIYVSLAKFATKDANIEIPTYFITVFSTVASVLCGLNVRRHEESRKEGSVTE
jgi:hypothetical protein